MSDPRKPEQIEAEIEQQREELARTVDQLQAKLDVKAHAVDAVTTDDGKPRPVLLAAAAGAVVVVVALVVWRRRR